MNVQFSVDVSGVENMEGWMADMVDAMKPRVQSAMAEQFHGIVLSNLGPTGVDRPIPWAPLSNRPPHYYATKVGRMYATLYETGLLASSINWNGDNPDHSEVYVDSGICEYAARHQTGDPNTGLPARPFFPMTPSGEVTPYTSEAVTDAAKQEIERVLATA